MTIPIRLQNWPEEELLTQMMERAMRLCESALREMPNVIKNHGDIGPLTDEIMVASSAMWLVELIVGAGLAGFPTGITE